MIAARFTKVKAPDGKRVQIPRAMADLRTSSFAAPPGYDEKGTNAPPNARLTVHAKRQVRSKEKKMSK